MADKMRFNYNTEISMFKGARSRYFRQFCLILLIMSSKRQIADQESFIFKIMAT